MIDKRPELLRRFLESLVHVTRADAGRLYMLNENASVWELRAGTPKPTALSIQNRPGLIKKLSKPRYLNGAIELVTDLDPKALLDSLHAIEASLGCALVFSYVLSEAIGIQQRPSVFFG